MQDHKSPKEMEALALELSKTDLNMDVPAKTRPICGSNMENNEDG